MSIYHIRFVHSSTNRKVIWRSNFVCFTAKDQAIFRQNKKFTLRTLLLKTNKYALRRRNFTTRWLHCFIKVNTFTTNSCTPLIESLTNRTNAALQLDAIISSKEDFLSNFNLLQIVNNAKYFHVNECLCSLVHALKASTLHPSFGNRIL